MGKDKKQYIAAKGLFLDALGVFEKAPLPGAGMIATGLKSVIEGIDVSPQSVHLLLGRCLLIHHSLVGNQGECGWNPHPHAEGFRLIKVCQQEQPGSSTSARSGWRRAERVRTGPIYTLDCIHVLMLNRRITSIKNEWEPDPSRGKLTRFLSRDEDKTKLRRCFEEIDRALEMFQVRKLKRVPFTVLNFSYGMSFILDARVN
jgi:hypothetical protein